MNLDDIPSIYHNDNLNISSHNISSISSSSILKNCLKNTVNDYISYININGKTFALLTSSTNNDILSSLLLSIDPSFQNESSVLLRKQKLLHLSKYSIYELSNILHINIYILNINGSHFNIKNHILSSHTTNKYIMLCETNSNPNTYYSIGLKIQNGISFIQEQPIHKLLNIYIKKY